MARSTLEPTTQTLLALKRIDLERKMEDPHLHAIIEAIDKHGDFIIEDDALFHVKPGDSDSDLDKRLAVPHDHRHSLLELAHDDQVYGGHLGNRKTIRKLKQFWWPRMTSDVKEYIKYCQVCQRYKEPKGPAPGLLHPIPVSRLFEQVHLDIVGPINAKIYCNRYRRVL